MASVTLTGPVWTEALLDCVAGAGAAFPVGDEPVVLSDKAAERALFFAEVAGLEILGHGQDRSILPPESTDPAVLAEAAPEIMGYFGRVLAGDLRARRQMILSRAAARVIAAKHPAQARLRSDLHVDRINVQDRQTPHEGFFLTRSYRLRHPEFGGGMTEPLTREVFVATDAAIVLPYDPVRDRILLIEQFRMGPFGRGDPRPWVLEPVAGRVDAGETPDETARRECVEEADLTLDRLEHVTSHYCSPGCSTEMFHCYIGLCDLPRAGQSLGGLDAEHEDLRRHVIAFDEALELTRTGEVNIGPLFALILWLERERPRLRASA